MKYTFALWQCAQVAPSAQRSFSKYAYASASEVTSRLSVAMVVRLLMRTFLQEGVTFAPWSEWV